MPTVVDYNLIGQVDYGLKVMDKLIDAFEIIAFLLLLVLVGFAIGVGALKDNALAIVIIVIAVLSPSPYRIYLKLRDWVEIHRNGGQVRTPSQNPHPQSGHQTPLPQDDEATPLPEEGASPTETHQSGS
jgi:hypothetical protein